MTPAEPKSSWSSITTLLPALASPRRALLGIASALIATQIEPALATTICSDAQDSWFLGWHADFAYRFDLMEIDPERNVIALGGYQTGSISRSLISLWSYSTDSTTDNLTELYSYNIRRPYFDGIDIGYYSVLGVNAMRFSEI